jgi:ketosteroid isomerase-like protein
VVPPSANTASLAAQKATAQAFIDGFHAWDIDAILSYRTPDCLQEVRPKSITKPAKNNTEYAAYFAKIKPLFQNFTVIPSLPKHTKRQLTQQQVTVFDEIHDAEAGMSVIHASSDAMTSVGPYSNEYSLFFHFTKDGKKIKKIDEFVDSKYTAEFFPKLPIPA